jgi:hypothetical protein
MLIPGKHHQACVLCRPADNSAYYFSSSPADRQRIVNNILGPDLVNGHLAAKSFLCAVRHTWLLQQSGSHNRAKASQWSIRTRSFLFASKQLLRDHSTPLSSRIGSLLDVRLGHVSHWPTGCFGAVCVS